MSNTSDNYKLKFKFYTLTSNKKAKLYPVNGKSIVRYRNQRKRSWLKRNA